MRKSAALFIVLAVQPVLTLAVMIANILLYAVPIGRNFGLVPLLAGVRKESVSLLNGAAFSGKLLKPVFVRTKLTEIGTHKTAITYDLVLETGSLEGTIESKPIYLY